MRLVASFMTTYVSKLVYYRSFHSIMSYGVIFSGDSIEGKRLFTTQKKVIRIMAKALERKLSGSFFKPFSTPPRLHNFSWHFEYTLLNGEIIFKISFVFHTFTGYMFVKTCSYPLYLCTDLSYNFILIGH